MQIRGSRAPAKGKYKYLTKEWMAARKKVRASVAKVFSATKHGGSETGNLPMWHSMKQYCPAPVDQGQEGSCTANAFQGGYRTTCKYLKNADAEFVPSRSYYYFHERLTEDSQHDPADLTDSGADEVDGLQWAVTSGVCSETSWPYVSSNMNTPPTAECETEAAKHKISSYSTITMDENLITNIESAICSGMVVLIAINVYNSFEGSQPAATGMIPIPTPQNWGDAQDPVDPYMGGHEMCLVGYDGGKKLFTVMNSWGTQWGNRGFCYIPYAYLTNPNLGVEFTVIHI
jgi:C1A family cysteine protease